MCGIVGYIGDKDAVPILMEGLKKLEYRGYDSAGIAVISNGKIKLRKRQGKVSALALSLKASSISSRAYLGLSHVRWATHGEPNRVNAHPHTDCKKNFSLVHNGIIENYQELMLSLLKQGHKFSSQTDTEVIVHLIEEHYRGNLLITLQKVIALLRGSFALAVITSTEPDRIVVARSGSPLVIGLGKGENFVASDVTAILKYTKRVIFLENNQTGLVTKDRVSVFGRDNILSPPRGTVVKWDARSAQ
jgi:glucosamine--fructose-6-phosphate aminotransferase (isomerizing)